MVALSPTFRPKQKKNLISLHQTRKQPPTPFRHHSHCEEDTLHLVFDCALLWSITDVFYAEIMQFLWALRKHNLAVHHKCFRVMRVIKTLPIKMRDARSSKAHSVFGVSYIYITSGVERCG